MGLLRQRTGPFHRIGDSYASFFNLDHFLGRTALEDSWITQPPTNIKKEEDTMVMEIAMPGFKRNEVKMEIKDDTLYVSAKKRAAPEAQGYLKRGMPEQIAPQMIKLDPQVDQDKITAKLTNGVLYIHIPHSERPSQSSKSIRVS